MRSWSADRIAACTQSALVREPADAQGPTRASIDTRTLAPGELFVGLRGEREDGGAHAAEALARGAWGALVSPPHAQAAARAGAGAVLAHRDPLHALQALARGWRGELCSSGAQVVAITGSTGKTSTKDMLAALLATQLRTSASSANLNTEIGLPLAILAAPPDTQALVLEMAMRGSGQIAALTAIAEPDVGVIVNVGPAHLELLGSLEAIAAAKAELIAGLRAGATAVVPAHEPLLGPHLRAELRTITFGEGGDVQLLERRSDGAVVIDDRGERIELSPSFRQRHNLQNLLAAVAAARCLGVRPEGPLEVRFSAMRGERLQLAGDLTVIDDCYNANPMSMCAAIDDLADTAPGRRIAVLGDMLELGAQAPRLHRDVARHATERGVDVVVAVGPLAAQIAEAFGGEAYTVADAPGAAELLDRLLLAGDTVLVKGSRGVGLERTVAALRARARPPRAAEGPALAPGAAGSRRD
jgi:UDP-N-acetylmuramoyl-tripeptide--D-alanyl-D-alanine ligase